VARHANAGRLWLDLEEAGDQVRLEIRDPGVGFRPVPSSVLVRDGRFGLAGMRERVEMAGGSLQVDARRRRHPPGLLRRPLGGLTPQRPPGRLTAGCAAPRRRHPP
jgi:hypothetical protein